MLLEMNGPQQDRRKFLYKPLGWSHQSHHRSTLKPLAKRQQCMETKREGHHRSIWKHTMALLSTERWTKELLDFCFKEPVFSDPFAITGTFP